MFKDTDCWSLNHSPLVLYFYSCNFYLILNQVLGACGLLVLFHVVLEVPDLEAVYAGLDLIALGRQHRESCVTLGLVVGLLYICMKGFTRR